MKRKAFGDESLNFSPVGATAHTPVHTGRHHAMSNRSVLHAHVVVYVSGSGLAGPH